MKHSISALNDSILGGLGDDALDGLGGDDTIDGGSGGIDTLYGGLGDDLLWTRTDDQSYGGDGNDTISVAGDGPSVLDGGVGSADILRFEGGYDITGATVTGFEQLWIAGTALMTASQLNGFQLVSGYNPAYTNAGVSLTQGGTAAITLSSTLTNGFTLIGSGGADIITFNATFASAISVNMGGGNDKVTTGAGNDSIQGGDGSDILSGLDGNDSIDGGNGGDSMSGGNGNDYLVVNGADSAYGGAGNDLISIAGNQAVILNGGFGTADVLRFEGAYDITGAALSGIETLNANSQAYMTASQFGLFTTVSGYASNYTTAGVILTQGGTASVALSVTLSQYFALTGSAGADLITFAPGYNATIYAYMGAGNDSVTTSNGADTIRGEAGNDTLMGMGGDDTIDGGSGFDSLNGGSGNDLLLAGTGDTVMGSLGDDLISITANMPAALDGGIGNDTLRFENGFDISGTTISGFEQANLYGTDYMTTAQLAQFAAVSGYNASYTTATVVLTHGGTANITVLPTVTSSFSLTGSAEAENLTFTPSSIATVYAYMGGGNDSVAASSGADSLRGDEGDDTLLGNQGNDSIDGGSGNDLLYGGFGSDLLILRMFDSAYGGANDDLISINENLPLVIDGGTGHDILRFENSFDISGATINAMEQLNLNGNDTMTATQLAAFGTVSGYGPGYTTGTMTLSAGGTAAVTLDPGMTAYFSLTGSADADILTFAPGYTATIYAYVGGGDDSVIAASGNDSLRGEDGNDSLYGNAGNDSIDGGFGNDVLLGQAGNDTIDGGWGFDSVDGGIGDDLLYARMGDSIYGGTGNDMISVQENLPASIDGGIGNDTLRFESSYDITGTKLTGVENLYIGGSPSMTTAQLASFTLVSGYNASQTGATLTLTTGGTASVNLSNTLTSYFQLYGSGQDDKISFNASYNATVYVYAGVGNDSITGASGADSLYGGIGNDTLLGMSGNDNIFGGNGADVITGGSGVDTLTGGLGQDIFVFATTTSSDPSNPDRINDFEAAGVGKGDLIDVSGIDADGNIGTHDAFTFGSTGLAGLSVVDSGTDTLVQLNTDNDAAFEITILIIDGAVTAASYTAADFIL